MAFLLFTTLAYLRTEGVHRMVFAGSVVIGVFFTTVFWVTVITSIARIDFLSSAVKRQKYHEAMTFYAIALFFLLSFFVALRPFHSLSSSTPIWEEVTLLPIFLTIVISISFSGFTLNFIAYWIAVKFFSKGGFDSDTADEPFSVVPPARGLTPTLIHK